MCSPGPLPGKVAFIGKVVSAVARPSTHTSLRGASPQALSGLPAPLSSHLLYKQARVHAHTLTHTHSLCNYCQGGLCRESVLQPSCSTILPAGSLSMQIHFIRTILRTRGVCLIKESLRDWMVMADQPVMTSIKDVLHSIINITFFLWQPCDFHISNLQ